jgi:hypothetical protein
LEKIENRQKSTKEESGSVIFFLSTFCETNSRMKIKRKALVAFYKRRKRPRFRTSYLIRTHMAGDEGSIEVVKRVKRVRSRPVHTGEYQKGQECQEDIIAAIRWCPDVEYVDSHRDEDFKCDELSEEHAPTEISSLFVRTSYRHQRIGARLIHDAVQCIIKQRSDSAYISLFDQSELQDRNNIDLRCGFDLCCLGDCVPIRKIGVARDLLRSTAQMLNQMCYFARESGFFLLTDFRNVQPALTQSRTLTHVISYKALQN